MSGDEMKKNKTVFFMIHMILQRYRVLCLMMVAFNLMHHSVQLLTMLHIYRIKQEQ